QCFTAVFIVLPSHTVNSVHTEPTPPILLQNTIGQLGRENLAVCNPPGTFSGIGPFMSRLFIAPKLE
ncbi:hypothetical protein, partial [uncultured Duodenibacillus sp.]|uniref:hypothetical protein n=1 Tax=uncultured Duodenibacillus sp. TaxID=1980699 RepID=UPI0028052919